MSVRLPVFPLAPASGDGADLERLATRLFNADDLKTEQLDDRVVARSGSIVLELDRSSGGIWAADEKRLWNASETPSLVPEERVYGVAGELLGGLDVLPRFDEDAPFALMQVGLGGTHVATRSNGHSARRRLDVQARYGVAVRNPGVEGAPDLLPVVGGGGKFTLTLGDEGRPVAYYGLWRPAGEAEIVEALDASDAEARFAALMNGVEVADARSFLAYYAAPFSADQPLLTPVYVFSAGIVVDGKELPARLVTIPATELGPQPPESKPQPPRYGQPGRLGALAPRRGARAINPFEAGTSWIGLSGGLAGSQANAQGFVDGLAADGWNVNFNWGDGNAWESDWRRNDDTWVDAADFVFYTGHADMNGWVLASPDDGSLTFTEVGGAPATPGDLWGQQDLEWMIIAACGPLQDELLAAGGGDVLARWDGAFDGLHTLMGYGAITFDNTEEGKRIVKYSKQGTPLIDAWFRTAQEIQPSTNGAGAPDGPDVWVGAMWVAKAGADPRSDHLWGHGSVSPDPTSPTVLACMWTTC
ncbi:MAG TPA: DUF6345 domain-containing protein [Solirubrobacteraceae bacterium]|nr:DUF6345 domain-containing protein [Solirubrobacteraceae bacterium]